MRKDRTKRRLALKRETLTVVRPLALIQVRGGVEQPPTELCIMYDRPDAAEASNYCNL